MLALWTIFEAKKSVKHKNIKEKQTKERKKKGIIL